MAPLLPLSCKQLYVGRGDNKVTGSPVERRTLGWSVRRRPCRPVIYRLLLRWRLVWRNHPPTGRVPDNDANTSLWVYSAFLRVRSFFSWTTVWIHRSHEKKHLLLRFYIKSLSLIDQFQDIMIVSLDLRSTLGWFLRGKGSSLHTDLAPFEGKTTAMPHEAARALFFFLPRGTR